MDPHGWPTGALKRASASSDDDYDVLCEGAVVGRGYGRSPTATTKTARRRTAMRRHARPRWRHSRRAGGASRPAEEVARLTRPKEKPWPPGLLLGRPGRGYVQNAAILPRDICFHYGAIVRFRHCGIFTKRCRDINCVLSGAHIVAGVRVKYRD